MRAFTWRALVLSVFSVGSCALGADRDFIGTWKLNVQQSSFGLQRFRAGTITIDEVLPAAQAGTLDDPGQGGIRWTQEFIDENGKYQAWEWAGSPDGRAVAYHSRRPGMMSVRRRDERTLELSIVTPGAPAISGTCSLSADRKQLVLTNRSAEAREATDTWILNRSLATNVDLQVLQRADELLRDPSAWDRNGARRCPAGARKFTLICALQQAQVQLTGSYEHRAPSMEEVRKRIDELTKDRNYEHRLGEYNNDPTTSFADIKAVLRIAIERIAQQLRESGR